MERLGAASLGLVLGFFVGALFVVSFAVPSQVPASVNEALQTAARVNLNVLQRLEAVEQAAGITPPEGSFRVEKRQ
jgi:hypothetical protein